MSEPRPKLADALKESPDARACLFGLAAWHFVFGATCALLAASGPTEGRVPLWLVVILAAPVGWILAALQWHPRRALAWVPFGALGACATLAWAAFDGPGVAAAVAFGVPAGLTNGPLVRGYVLAFPATVASLANGVRLVADFACLALGGATVILLTNSAEVPVGTQFGVLAAVAGALAVAALWYFRRPVAEQLLEFVFFVMYRFRAAGPGLATFPVRGPVLVVANHSAWFDPLWLGKVIPRRIIPMMTSVFFDRPLLGWCMVYLADAIRVQASGFRREVPELEEAVAALDRGHCVMLFPEGAMRRKEDRPLKMFGQGVWRILQDRPQTPVVVCWIEGGWGSYFSYAGGPPTKNKRLDVRRPIGLSVGEPHVIDPQILADQRRTRVYLMERCAAMRAHLGLEPIKLTQDDEGL